MRPWPAAFVLLALSLAAWAPGLGGEFQYDDLSNIVLDPATSNLDALRERLANGFRPLLRLSYVADHALWGFAPAGFLATNLLLHAGTVLTVWALARHRLTDERAAFIAALAFALQPAHAAVVASASGRSTGLSTLLLALALLAHLRAGAARVQAAGHGLPWRALSLLLFALAVAAKEVALVYPALLLLWVLTRGPRPELRSAALEAAPAGIAAALLGALLLMFGTRLREISAYSLALATPFEALRTHAAALPCSLSLWLRPWALGIEHEALPPSAALPGGLALAAIVAAALACRRRAPVATLALLWPLAMLLPTHTILARLDPVVEKALYSAWIGPSLGLGALAGWLLARRSSRPSPWAGAALAGVAAALVLCCAWRAARWADPAALWQEATRRAPDSPRAWRNRALAEFGAGRLEEAQHSIEHAMALDPTSSRTHDTARAISLLLPPDAPSSAAPAAHIRPKEPAP